MYLQEAKLILENKNSDVFIYHYFYDKKRARDILSTGKLMSITSLPSSHPELKKYKNRDGISNPHDYFKKIYNEYYKDLIKKEYSTWGVYCTSLDFFSFPSKIVGRVKIPVNHALKYGPVTFEHGKQFGNKIMIIKNQMKIKKETLKYPTDPNKLMKLYRQPGKTYMFENMPQVVIWAKEFPIDKNMVEFV